MNESGEPGLAPLLLRQQVILVVGLTSVVSVSWAYLFWMARDMAALPAHTVNPGMNAMAMHGMGVTWILAMWVVMVGAMMLPTAAPMTFIHARFQRGRQPHRSPAVYTALFGVGYLVAWSLFALLATGAQVRLEGLALMHPMAMKLTSTPVAAAVLIAAGLFQFSSVKDACLSRCRTPVGFFMGDWREGRFGAFAMGVHHGIYCVGCCWALMAIMFVVGTMNMIWIAVLTAFMLYEKVGPGGSVVGKLTGGALIAIGLRLLLV